MKNVFKMTAIATSIMASSVAFAAESDSATSTVSVDVPNALEMTGLAAVDLGEFDGSDMSATEAFAVCQNFGSGFIVTVTDTDLTAGDDTITMTATAGTNGAMQSIAACNGTPTDNASVNISVLASDINAVDAGEYSGTVTVTIAAAN
jgi:hypothetical protein